MIKIITETTENGKEARTGEKKVQLQKKEN